MSKKGAPKHLKRIASQTAVLIHNRKAATWLVKGKPGPHNKKVSLPLMVLIRDVLGFATNAREVKKILTSRTISVDGRIRIDPHYVLGIMDIVKLTNAGKSYRIGIDSKSRLIPVEISDEESKKKIAKVISKHTAKKKIVLHLHDGKNIISNELIKVGDSVVVMLPQNKIERVIKLEKGARCLITEGKHAGTVAFLEELIEQKGGRRVEARLNASKGEFITVANYLLVVDEQFKGV